MNVDRVAHRGGSSFVPTVPNAPSVLGDVQYGAIRLVLTVVVPELLGDELRKRDRYQEGAKPESTVGSLCSESRFRKDDTQEVQDKEASGGISPRV